MLPSLSFLWTAPVQIAISFYLLYNEMGVSVVGGIVLMILFIPINGYISAKVKGLQTKQMKLKDQRLRAMNEILSGIKVLKVFKYLYLKIFFDCS